MIKGIKKEKANIINNGMKIKQMKLLIKYTKIIQRIIILKMIFNMA